MLWVDIGILAIIAISAGISIFRGLIREVLSLVAWIVAFWVAFSFSSQVADLLETVISVPSARQAIGFIILFVGTLLVGGGVNYFVIKLVNSTGLSGTDRALGVIFGIVRGMVIVLILVLLAGLTPVPGDPWWHESLFIGHFQQLAMKALAYLPSNVAGYFSY